MFLLESNMQPLAVYCAATRVFFSNFNPSNQRLDHLPENREKG